MGTTVLIGDKGPEFTLCDLSGETHHLSDFRGRINILNFWSAECPWSARADKELIPALARWKKQVVLLTLASNANEPLDLITRTAVNRQLPLVLYDPYQKVADLYGAVTNPHFFVLDPDGVLRYQGALDDVNFYKREAGRRYLLDAVDALIQGRYPDPEVSTPFGCIIVRYNL
jgi:peroxiredoxin